MRWRPGLRPGPAGGAHDAPPDPLVGWEGGHPLPKNTTPLDPLAAWHIRCLISTVYPPLFLAVHHWNLLCGFCWIYLRPVVVLSYTLLLCNMLYTTNLQQIAASSCRTLLYCNVLRHF